MQSHILDDIHSERSEELPNESKLDSSQDYFEECKSAEEH